MMKINRNFKKILKDPFIVAITIMSILSILGHFLWGLGSDPHRELQKEAMRKSPVRGMASDGAIEPVTEPKFVEEQEEMDQKLRESVSLDEELALKKEELQKVQRELKDSEDKMKRVREKQKSKQKNEWQKPSTSSSPVSAGMTTGITTTTTTGKTDRELTEEVIFKMQEINNQLVELLMKQKLQDQFKIPSTTGFQKLGERPQAPVMDLNQAIHSFNFGPHPQGFQPIFTPPTKSARSLSPSGTVRFAPVRSQAQLPYVQATQFRPVVDTSRRAKPFTFNFGSRPQPAQPPESATATQTK